MPSPGRAAVTSASLRQLAQQTFSRVAGAPLIAGNAVELLIDAPAHFKAWLSSIRGAQRSILFENYIFCDDEIGRAFRDALVERAPETSRFCVVAPTRAY